MAHNQASMMTRAASVTAFTSAMTALNLTGVNEPIRVALRQNSIDNIVDLFSLSESQIQDLRVEEVLGTGGAITTAARTVPITQRNKILHLCWWRDNRVKENPTESIDWQVELTEDIFYDWCQQKVPQIVRGRSASQSGATGQSASSRFAANVKLDVKAYPTWNGELGGWAGFNRATTSLAASHKLSRVLISPAQWVEPNPGTDDEELFTQQNTFMYSVWANRITGGNASTTVKQYEIAKDGMVIKGHVTMPKIRVV